MGPDPGMATPLSESSPRWIDVQLTEENATDGYRDMEVSSHRLLPAPGTGPIGSIAAMVEVLERLCSRHGARIRRLILVCHGHPGGFWIGRDWVSLARLPQHAPQLGRLTACFGGRESAVTIHSCEAGTDPRLLAALSALWGGVAVVGYLDRYYKEVFKPVDPVETMVCKLRLRGVAFADQEL